MRRNSSTAVSISPGLAASSRMASGLRSSRSTLLPIRLVVVSCPALSRKMQLCSSSASDRRSVPPPPSPSSLAATSLERISPWSGVRSPWPPRDLIAQEVLELGDRGDAGVELLGRERRLQRAKDAKRPVAQRPALGLRDAEQIADQLHRDRRGEILDQVDGAAFGGSVEQPVDQRLDARAHHLQRARREGRRQQLADAGVNRRIVEDEAGGVVLVQQAVAKVRLERRFLVGAPGPGVAIDLDQIVVAGEEIRAVRQAVHRVVLAQRAIDRIGIVEEGAVELREVKRR